MGGIEEGQGRRKGGRERSSGGRGGGRRLWEDDTKKDDSQCHIYEKMNRETYHLSAGKRVGSQPWLQAGRQSGKPCDQSAWYPQPCLNIYISTQTSYTMSQISRTDICKLQIHTPEVQQARERRGRSSPHAEVGRAHVANHARRMRVVVDERVRGLNLLLRHVVCLRLVGLNK
jgi:hypothetical protein